jgi:DNA repair protein RadC
METRKSGSERGAEESMVRNHHTGASASTLRAPQPSQEDRALTKRLVDAGQLLGITVLDHIILGDGSETYYSFADEGLLP